MTAKKTDAKNPDIGTPTDEDFGHEIASDPAQTLDVGDEYTGIYLGSSIVEGQHGPTQHHLFLEPDMETRITFWGSMLLDEAMAKSKLGRVTRIIHTTEKRGRAHVYSVRQHKTDPKKLDREYIIGRIND